MKRKTSYVLLALVAVVLLFVLVTNNNAKEVTVEEEVYVFLLENGFSPVQACGIMANIAAISNFDSNATYDFESDEAYGICLWVGPLRERLEEFAVINGVPVSDIETQLNFMVQHLKYVISCRGREGEAFLEADTPAKAAESFADLYVRDPNMNYEFLKSKAKDFYRIFN